MADQPESDFDFEGELASMDDVQTGSTLLPEDDYVWVVKGARSTVSKNGTNGIKLNLEITEGPYRGAGLIHDIWYSNKSDAAVKFFWRQVGALGITSSWLREQPDKSMKFMASLAPGVVLNAKIKHEEYMDEARARTQLGKIVGSNPNITGGGAVTGVAGPPAVSTTKTLPPVRDEDDSVGATVGGSADDPWGSA